jgi:hypothetical protein
MMIPGATAGASIAVDPVGNANVVLLDSTLIGSTEVVLLA